VPARRSAEPSQGDHQPPKAATVGKAAASLFSPVFSLFGGKAASEVPPPAPGESDDGGRGAADADEPAGPAAKGDSGDAEPAGPLRPAVAADDDVHSENDTQIRVPSGHSSGSQARPLTQTQSRTRLPAQTRHLALAACLRRYLRRL
jgi:hypothetical protein